MASGIAIHNEKLTRSSGVIDARNSGTTMRLMTGIASLLPSETTLTGDSSLVARPMAPLVDALEELGASAHYLGKRGAPPLTVSGPIKGGKAGIRADVSSQFISSLLIACTQKAGDTSIDLRGALRSGPYVRITLDVLRDFGASVKEREGGYEVRGEQRLARDTYRVPGDYSSAAFPLAAAAITGGEVTVRDLEKDSLQGDRAVVDVLERFGVRVTRDADAVTVAAEPSGLQGCELDVKDTPDLFPIAAVVAAVASGTTVIVGGETLRHKESDRIAATTEFLRRMGADITPTKDGCTVTGGRRLRGAEIDTRGDHRIFMAAAIAGLAATGDTVVQDNDSYAVSYPGFMRDMHQLGCRMKVRR